MTELVAALWVLAGTLPRTHPEAVAEFRAWYREYNRECIGELLRGLVYEPHPF